MLHHGASYASPLVLWMNSNVFHDARFPATLRHIVQDRQFIRTNDDLIDYSYKDTKVWVASQQGQVRDCLLDGEARFAVDTSITVKLKKPRNVLFSRNPNRQIVHT